MGLSGLRITFKILQDIGPKSVNPVNDSEVLIEFQNQLPRVQAPKWPIEGYQLKIQKPEVKARLPALPIEYRQHIEKS